MYIRFGILCHMLIFSIYLSYSLIFSRILLNTLISSFFLTFHLPFNLLFFPCFRSLLPFLCPAPALSIPYQKSNNKSAVNHIIKRSFLRYYCPIIGFSSVLNICIYRLYQSIIYIIRALYAVLLLPFFVHCIGSCPAVRVLLRSVLPLPFSVNQ